LTSWSWDSLYIADVADKPNTSIHTQLASIQFLLRKNNFLQRDRTTVNTGKKVAVPPLPTSSQELQKSSKRKQAEAKKSKLKPKMMF
jgi:hypothetical protein